MCNAREINLENQTQSPQPSFQFHSSSSTKPFALSSFNQQSISSTPPSLTDLLVPPVSLYHTHHPVLSLSLAMRIRRNASKLLGSAIVYSSAPFPPPSDTWDPTPASNPSICASSGELCELNQSPWDVYPNLHFFTSSFKDVESTPCLKEAKEEVPDTISANDKGILGNSPEKETIEESETKPLQVCKRVDVKKITEKKTRTKKKKGNCKTTPILCKKNDGKKWSCKRPAQLPNSFCEYHLTQSRSYYSNQTEKEAYEQESRRKTRKKKATVRGVVTSSSPYYYYNGYGPYSRKRRGARNAESGDDTMHVDDKKKVGDDVAMHVDDEKKVDECDEPVAGVVEEEDCVVDDKAISGSNGEGKRVKKRRRKPMKCRSLKSLL
ncbi:hypothetical protein LUZ61_010020 [Rhynchospora tenuis]|uniref:WRC domain-containing protein n=1 Tax=Rhynchospora tenuis TaxID=198213 RepID=A0AAD6EZ44_9POAL|nr:hypothetical protein LUZ61_010020 [Rhynchospora tenuis]